MSAERLLAEYERIADAPNAIQRLRRFILDLAVRGKLVAQDLNDEPASDLLKRITSEKARLFKAGEIRKQERDNLSTDFDRPFAIPRTWQWVPATYPAYNVSDSGKKVQTKDVLEHGQFPVVDQGKVFIRGYCNDPEKVIRLSEPLILFGDHTRETKLIDFDFVVGADGVKLLRPVIVFARYYFLALTWLPLDNRGYGRHFRLLKASGIPLPPLAEQHRIVAKIDELMALCDQLEKVRAGRETTRERLTTATLAAFDDSGPESLSKNATNALGAFPAITVEAKQVRKMREMILRLAMRGRLVRQEPTDEPMKVLTRDVGGSDRDKREQADKLQSAVFPHAIPASWRWARLEELAIKITDGEHLSPAKTSEGMKLLTAVHVTTSGLTLEQPQFVSERDGLKFRLRCDPRRGDILICSRGTIGRCAVVDTDEVFCLMGSVILLRLPQEMPVRFLHAYLSTDAAQSLMRGMSGATAVKALYLKDIRKCLIPLPPVSEQHRIVAKIDELMALCDQLEAALAKGEETREKLLEALLHEALQGPDPDLEHAA